MKKSAIFFTIDTKNLPTDLPHVVTFTSRGLEDIQVVVFNTNTHQLVSRAWLAEESEQMYARARLDILKQKDTINKAAGDLKTEQVKAQTELINAVARLASGIAQMYDCGPRQN